MMPGTPPRLAPGAAPGGPRRSNAGIVAGAAAAVLLIIAGVTVVRLLTLERPAGTASFGGTSTASVTPSPNLTPSDPASPSPPSTPPQPPPPPPPFTLNADAELCNPPLPNELRVTATSTVPLSQARVFYQPLSAPVKDRAMTVSGSTAHLEFSDWGSFAPEVRWWVVARSTDGRTRTTPEELAFTGPC
jgi:hypothetical protein